MYSAATHSHSLWLFDPPSGSLSITPRHQPFTAIPTSHSQLSSQVVGASRGFQQPAKVDLHHYLSMHLYIHLP